MAVKKLERKATGSSHGVQPWARVSMLPMASY